MKNNLKKKNTCICNMYTCICTCNFAIHLKLTQYCKSTTHQFKKYIKKKRVSWAVSRAGIWGWVGLMSSGMAHQPAEMTSCFQFVCCSCCVQLCHPMDDSPPGSSVHRIFQAREWVFISFSTGPSPPRDQTHISYAAGEFFTVKNCESLYCTPITYIVSAIVQFLKG